MSLRKVSSLAQRMTKVAKDPIRSSSILNNNKYPNIEKILSTNESDCLNNEEGEENPERHKHSSSVGSFTLPHSPPIITLYESNLTSFYLSALEHVFGPNWQVQKISFLDYARLVNWKTFYHELFHFHSWYFRTIISKEPFNPLLEEALAVAFAYHKLNEKLKWSLQKKEDYLFLNKIHGYTGRGYRDWINYKTRPDFDIGIEKYFIGNMPSQAIYKDWKIFRNNKDLYKSIVPQEGSYFLRII